MIRLLFILLLATTAQAQLGPHSFSNNATLFVAMHGNDSTAIRGRSDRAWRTVSNAVAAAQSYDTVIIHNGRYTNTLHYSNTVAGFAVNGLHKTNLTIRGSGAGTVLYAPGLGSLLNFSNCPGLLLENFVIEGNKPNTAWSGTYVTNGYVNAINLSGRTVGTIRNVGINHWANMGINGAGLNFGNTGVEMTVDNCWGENVGYTNGPAGLLKDGAFVQITGPNWSVSRCRVTNVVRGVELWDTTGEATVGARITDNIFTGVRWQGIVGQSATSNCVIRGNYIQADATLLVTTDSHGMLFTGNTEGHDISGNSVVGMGSSGNGIELAVNNVRLRWNHVTGNSINNAAVGIQLIDNSNGNTNVTGNLICHNSINATSAGGIHIAGIGNIVSFNQITRFGNRGIGSYGHTFGVGTNLWQHITHNIIRFGTTGIDIIDATSKTNYIRNNFINNVTTRIVDSGQGTVQSDNMQ